MNTQDQINNLEVLLAAVEAQPVTLFDLTKYRQTTACGTLFCTVGLATTLPHFQALGFAIVTERLHEGDTRAFTGVKIGASWAFDDGVTEEYFGVHFDELFSPAGCADFDDSYGYDFNEDTDEANMTDKELAIARLKHAIAQLKEQA